MGWRKARFKDADVWIEVNAQGEPVVSGGRVPMRYSAAEGAKIYRAAASRVQVKPSAPVEALPDGVSADATKGAKSARGNGSGFGKAGTRSKAQAAAALASAKQQLAELPEGTIRAFTDGACKGNPGPAGSGAVIELPDGRRGEWARALGRATNNIAELTAIEMALELLDDADIPPSAPVALFSDSSYARGVLTQGWKAKANQELIRQIKEKLAARPGVVLHWVAGHVGIPGNERADELANLGVLGRDTRAWSEDAQG